MSGHLVMNGEVLGIRYLRALLTRCRTRKVWKCARCKGEIPKSAWAWRVLVEAPRFARYNRICMVCAQAIVGDAGTVKEKE